MSQECAKIEEFGDRASETDLHASLYDRAHLKMISLMHNSMYRLLVDPNHLLKAAGLATNQTVLEVGCGPGFFTTPAAEIVGINGRLFTIDINPAAVKNVKRKITEKGLTNVDARCADVVSTGLAEETIDVAFLFGILHDLKDLDSVLLEMHRVLKQNGVLAVQKSASSEKKFAKSFHREGIVPVCRKGGENL